MFLFLDKLPRGGVLRFLLDTEWIVSALRDHVSVRVLGVQTIVTCVVKVDGSGTVHNRQEILSEEVDEVVQPVQ